MSSADRLRIAAAQYPIGEPATFAEWRAKQAEWIEAGAATGAPLLVLPEYGLMELAAIAGRQIAGDLNASLSAVADKAQECSGAFRELARRHGVLILAPSGPERHDGRILNAARLYTPSGAVGVAHKSIMTPFEVRWGVSGGDGPVVFDTAIGRIGVAICYDSEFPLLVRTQTEAGADIVLIPSCTERISGFNRIRTSALARALESQIVTVVSPTVGEAPWSPAVDHNRGAAGIFVPAEHGLSETGVLAEGTLDRAQWVVADVDLAAVREIRAKGEMRNDADWSSQPGAAPIDRHARMVRLY